MHSRLSTSFPRALPELVTTPMHSWLNALFPCALPGLNNIRGCWSLQDTWCFPGAFAPRPSSINVSFHLHSLQEHFLHILDYRTTLKSSSANSNILISVSCLFFGELVVFFFYFWGGGILNSFWCPGHWRYNMEIKTMLYHYVECRCFVFSGKLNGWI